MNYNIQFLCPARFLKFLKALVVNTAFWDINFKLEKRQALFTLAGATTIHKLGALLLQILWILLMGQTFMRMFTTVR
jgi:hypothetical protein